MTRMNFPATMTAHPDRVRLYLGEFDGQTLALVITAGEVDRADALTALGFTRQQAGRIAFAGMTVMNAPRPLAHVGYMPSDGRTLIDGEAVPALGTYPDAPFMNGRFYVAGDPSWVLRGDRTMADSWQRDGAVELRVVSVEELAAMILHDVRTHGSAQEADELVEYYPTPAELVDAWSIPVPPAAM